MLRLYYHPFASFCQKALIAFYEHDLPFEGEIIDLGDPAQRETLQRVWHFTKFPVLRDEERGVTVPESSLIIEYLDQLRPQSPPLVPREFEEALEVRLLDRVFDNYIAPSVTKVVIDSLRAPGRGDADGVEQARALIASAYQMLDSRLAGRGWAAGDRFSLADCAAGPALFYSNIVVPLGEHRNVDAYYRRLLARPSFARVIEEARPYRHLFPLPWPPEYA